MTLCFFETDRCNTRRNTTLTVNSRAPRRFQPHVMPNLARLEDGMDLSLSGPPRFWFSFPRRSSFCWTTFDLPWCTSRTRTDSNSTVQEERTEDNTDCAGNSVVEGTRNNQTADEEDSEEDSEKEEEEEDGIALASANRLRRAERCRRSTEKDSAHHR